MKITRLSYPLAFSIAALLTACGGSDVQTDTPPPAEPPPAPMTTPPAETAAVATPTTPTTEPSAKPKDEAPAAKPLKEKLVGMWVLDFSGDVKAAAEADAKKKAGTDEKKLADLMKKAEEAVTKQKVENTGDMMIRWDGDKATSKGKYEVVKEEGSTITVKRVGKDEVSKKDAPAAELVITFKDDSTIELKDPGAKDATKAKTLVFKKGAAAAKPAAPADAKPAAGPGSTSGAAPDARPAAPPSAKAPAPAAPPSAKPAAPPATK